jgi:hypothetical protein
MKREEMIAEIKVIEHEALVLIEHGQDPAKLSDEELLAKLESLGCKVQRLVTALNKSYGHVEEVPHPLPTLTRFPDGDSTLS